MPLPDPPAGKKCVVTAVRLSDNNPTWPTVMCDGDDRADVLARGTELKEKMPEYGDWLLNGEPL